jgi:hypothetical protein
VRQCVEESDHGSIFAEGLARVGYPLPAVRRAAPLPTTTALLNMLAELANSDILGYLATFAIMQQYRHRAPAEEHVRLRDHLTLLYPGSAPLFDALYKHAKIDVDLEHGEIVFDAVIRQRGLPTVEERNSISLVVERFAAAFREFFSGIQAYYEQGSCVVPRRRLAVDQFR